jgi:hypothetical protein
MAPPDRLEALERQLGSLDLTAEVTPIRVRDALSLAKVRRAAREYLEAIDAFRRGPMDKEQGNPQVE